MDASTDNSLKALFSDIQRLSFDYFLKEANPANGLIADRNTKSSPASIAAVGLALSAYPVGVERGFMTRAAAVGRTLATLRFFWNAPHGPEPDATGYKGFYYHFLDMQTGRRVWNTALLLAGALAAGAYFGQDDESELEIRRLADGLYRRADWRWAQNGGATITHGWQPEKGFLRYRWLGYDEALILYMLGLGSRTFPLPPESYAAWLSSYKWKRIYGRKLVYAGPLFIHQMSHIWIDFRGIRDAFMRNHGSDYFENSRQATYLQRDYAIRNPKGFSGYGENCWGFTASDGPGPTKRHMTIGDRRFFGYLARAAPFGPDDGTVSPWAAITSLPFAPEIVLPALSHFHEIDLQAGNPYGFTASFNPTIAAADGRACGWVSPDHIGINQGPIALMIENYRSDFLWRLMRGVPAIATGLHRAGFSGGWL
ncbi:hypothetical protein ABID26_003889 [Mesorhizobium shonense]|uniref:Glycoamylase-like domain-containing protein n=1 Tax=Mesorhizobium shonense TaxID=1209948 RepID=A0ABV2HV80_9HYPH